jgi:WD40-like Beta Propeller Repeat
MPWKESHLSTRRSDAVESTPDGEAQFGAEMGGGELGAEAVSFVDEVTGRHVRQLTNGDQPSVHAYYDSPPWHPVTGEVVFSRRKPGTPEGEVIVVDADGGTLTRVGWSRAMVPNCGAMAQWGTNDGGDGRRVYFRHHDGRTPLVRWFDVGSGESGSYPGSLRMMRPGVPEYAYHSERREYSADDLRPERRSEQGIFVRNLEDGSCRQLASVEDCLQIHPRRDDIVDLPLFVKHTKWSPAGDRLMFAFTSGMIPNRRPYVHEVYVVGADGSGLRRVGPMVNHPSWHPDGRHIFCNGTIGKDPEKKLVLLDVETGEPRLATDRVPGMGHPSYSPDGEWILLDDVPGRQGPASISIVHPASGELRQLVSTGVTDHSHDGTHLHPVWSQDGSQVLYASDASGVSQLCVVDVD